MKSKGHLGHKPWYDLIIPYFVKVCMRGITFQVLGGQSDVGRMTMVFSMRAG